MHVLLGKWGPGIIEPHLTTRTKMLLACFVMPETWVNNIARTWASRLEGFRRSKVAIRAYLQEYFDLKIIRQGERRMLWVRRKDWENDDRFQCIWDSQQCAGSDACYAPVWYAAYVCLPTVRRGRSLARWRRTVYRDDDGAGGLAGDDEIHFEPRAEVIEKTGGGWRQRYLKVKWGETTIPIRMHECILNLKIPVMSS